MKHLSQLFNTAKRGDTLYLALQVDYSTSRTKDENYYFTIKAKSFTAMKQKINQFRVQAKYMDAVINNSVDRIYVTAKLNEQYIFEKCIVSTFTINKI